MVLTLLAVVLASCTVSSTAPDATTTVVGRWSWVRSTGGLLPADRTPATEGYDMSLEFAAGGTVRIWFDDDFGGETTYEVGIGSSNGALEGTPVIRYGESLFGFMEQAYQFTDPDTMVLFDGCCDGFTWHFRRDSGS